MLIISLYEKSVYYNLWLYTGSDANSSNKFEFQWKNVV